MNLLVPLVAVALIALWVWQYRQQRKIFMKLSELSTTLNAASDTLDAILLRLPAAGGDPELGATNEAAVARLNASVQALNVAVPTPTP